MLSLPAFDVLYEHVRDFDDSTPAHRGPEVWSVSGSSVSLTTRSRKPRRILVALLTSGGVDVAVTFRVLRGWFRNRVVADLEIDGRHHARGIETGLHLRHSFDRGVVAKVVADLERQADQLVQETGHSASGASTTAFA